MGSHVAVVAGILGIIAFGYRAPVEASPSLNNQSIIEQNSSVDQIAAATVASTVAQTLDMSIEDNVQNLAVSLNAQTELAQTDNSFLAKPQIVELNSGRASIITYVTKRGDTVQRVAAAFGVSEDTIKWANNLSANTLRSGRELLIPGVTGVIYVVKSGDDVAKLASKYKADKNRIISYNNLEFSGLQPGARIVIPGGVLPTTERPGYVAPVSYSYSFAAGPTVYSGNTYAYGYCTYYAYNKRAAIGRPIGSNWGNANTWDDYARAAGFTVNHIPKRGAVIQNDGGWSGLGHVGIVDSVNADGSITVSDMNYAGWNVISTRTVPASSVRSFNYIH